MIHSRRHVFLLLSSLSLVTVLFLLIQFQGSTASRPGKSPLSLPEQPEPAVSFPRISDGHAASIAPVVVKPRDSGPSIIDVIRSRYRLAGITLNSRSPDRSLAIIEERESGRQRRLRPGDDLDESCRLSVVRTNSVLLSTAQGMVALFAERAQLASELKTTFSPNSASDMDEVMAKFGATRVDTNTWNFSRGIVMDYYNELLARPERLVKVFDSLAPVYNDKAKIEGYRVDIQGEKDFFKAIGFKQGDIVRSVNGIDMTNRRRAENLIRRYAADDLDFIVIELDRDGKREKQYYYSK